MSEVPKGYWPQGRYILLPTYDADLLPTYDADDPDLVSLSDPMRPPSHSDTHSRFTSGCPRHYLIGNGPATLHRPNTPTTENSISPLQLVETCGSYPGTTHDFYREGTKEYRDEKGQLDTSTMADDEPFKIQYEEMKALDAKAAMKAKELRKQRNSNRSKSKLEKAARANPFLTIVQPPPETPEWHQQTATMLQETADLEDDVANKRKKLMNNYIGYDTYKGHQGHKVRQNATSKKVKEYREAAMEHQRIAQGSGSSDYS